MRRWQDRTNGSNNWKQGNARRRKGRTNGSAVKRTSVEKRLTDENKNVGGRKSGNSRKRSDKGWGFIGIPR
jgi:hypothetical protein